VSSSTDSTATQDKADTARTTYARAVAGYDEAFQRALAEVITKAIFDVSTATDAKVCAIRTGETTDALVAVLATVIALRPEARVASQLRGLCEDLGKRLLRDVRSFRERNPDWDKGFFHGKNVEGSA
jgi:hypothetical protein